MSKLHNTSKTTRRTNRVAVASSALAAFFAIVGAAAPAHAGCGFYPTATVNWSANYTQQSQPQYGVSNPNRLVSVQPAAGGNVNWPSPDYTFYGRYSGGNADDRQPLNTSQFYRRGPAFQRDRGIGELNTVRSVWRDRRNIERVEVLRGASGSVYGRSTSYINQIRSLPRNQFNGVQNPIRIRGIGGNHNLQYGRSLVQFNGQANLSNQVKRVDVVGYRPAERIEVRATRFGDR